MIPRKYLAALAAALLMILPAAIFTPSPATAGWPGGIVWHAADDSGYNPPIGFRCDNGYHGTLGLGTSSKSYCGDADAVWVAAGTQLRCVHGDGRWETYRRDVKSGWEPLGNWTNMTCYQQLN